MSPRAMTIILATFLWMRGAAGAELAAIVFDGQKPLRNAVVLAVPQAGALPPTKRVLEIVDQIDKEFVPYVKVIRAGSAVQFPNKDSIRHHVYSFSPAKRFELPLYAGTPAQPVLFDRPGVVRLGCNVHDWMLAYIYVAETPYFGTSGADGGVVLTELPAGRYRVRVWHPRMDGAEDATVRVVDLQERAPARVEWILKLKPEFRPRRAPVPGDPGYR